MAVSLRELENLSKILAQLDLKLSQLRDALRGAGTRDLTTLETDIESILSKLDVVLSSRASEASLTRTQVESAPGVFSQRVDHRYWGGTALTGRDISQDLAKLQNLNITLSTIDSSIKGTQPRNITQIAGTALTGRDWSLDFAKLQNLDTTLSSVRDSLNLAKVGGVAQTARDWSSDFAKLQNLDVALSSVRDSLNIAKIGGIAQTGRDWSSDFAKLQNLDITLSTIDGRFPNVVASLVGADETVAQTISLDLAGRTVLSVFATADAATNFTLEGSDTSDFSVILYSKTYTGVTSVNDTLTTGIRYWRLRSAAAGTAGNKVTMKLSAGR